MKRLTFSALITLIFALFFCMNALALLSQQDDSETETPRLITAGNATRLTQIAAFEGHSLPVTALAFSPDGRLLASVADDVSLRLWNVESGAQLTELYDHVSFIKGVVFSPDGRLLVTTSWDRTVIIYSVEGETLTQTQVLDGFLAVVERVAFSPDGAWLAFGVGNGAVFALPTADLADEERRRLYTLENLQVTALAFSLDSALLAAAGGFPGQGARVWALDAEDEAPIAYLEGSAGAFTGLAFLPGVDANADDAYIISSVGEDGRLQLWVLSTTAAQTLTAIESLPVGAAEADENESAWLLALAFSPAADLLAGAALDGEIYFWQINADAQGAGAQQVALLNAHAGAVNTLAFSPDGALLASAGDDGLIRLWQAASP